MSFKLIDVENWERKEFYEHFIKEVVCTYSITVDLDITNLKGQRLYPAMIWLLTKTVNEMPEFRTSLTKEGLGIYDSMHPMYTVFNKDNKNFSGIWSYFSEDYNEFLQNYEKDEAEYSHSTRYAPKDGTPVNSFNISMLPWVGFTSVNINVYDEGKFLLRSLQWENSLNVTARDFCLFRFKCIMRFATDIMSVCSSKNFRIK